LIGYDAIAPDSIPADVPPPDYACGYVDGNWPSYHAMAQRFPKAVPVSITAIPGSAPGLDAQVCDCESGDYTPQQAALWAEARTARGVTPVIYCSLSEWPNVQMAVTVKAEWWIAAYPGNGPYLYPGSIGHQWIDRGSYDESVFLDGWVPGKPLAQPLPPETEDMDNPTFVRWAFLNYVVRQPTSTEFTDWVTWLNNVPTYRNDMIAYLVDQTPRGQAVLTARQRELGPLPA
jgi:hypothetical protein